MARRRDPRTADIVAAAVATATTAREDERLRELLAERRRREIRASMLGWATHRLAPLGQAPARHHRFIIDKLERVISGECDRLIILAPPGSAKSTYSTKLFVPYWFSKHPRSNVISASHTASLAGRFGREVRNMVDEEQETLGYSLREDSRAVDMWSTDAGGEYIAVGVGMAIAGSRADLVLIDDPFKGREDADSGTTREKVWSWYTGDVIGRLKPDARVILIMTRWHEDDLGGRLQQRMEDGTGDSWEVVRLEALCTDPATDPLGRSEGEALWPEWESRDKLLRKQRTVGNREWMCQYQQNPIAKGATLVDEDLLQIVPVLPSRVVSSVRCWDFAATEQMGSNNPDWTVGLLLGRLEDGRHAVLDVRRGRWSPMDVEVEVLGTAHDDGPDVPIAIPQDVGQAGKSQAQNYVRMLAGWVVRIQQQTGSKTTRAAGVIAQIEAQMLLVLRRHWTAMFVSEVTKFPSGSKDDQVDALSGAFNYMVEHGGSSSIMEYYGLLASQTPAQRGRVLELASSEYTELFAEAGGLGAQVQCPRCSLEVGATRVTDGVSSWHTECFS
jgi:predicted phage terminase large subunit-like protein